MVMTCRHTPSTARLALLVLLTVTPQLAGAAPVGGEGVEGGVEGLTRTHHKEDSLDPFHTPPGLSLPSPLDTTPLEQAQSTPTDMDPTRVLSAILLKALDHPGGTETEDGDREEEQHQEPGPLEARGSEEERRVGKAEDERGVMEGEKDGVERRMEQLGAALVAAAWGEELRVREDQEQREERSWLMEDEGGPADGRRKEGGEREDEEDEEGGEGQARLMFVSEGSLPSLQRKTRGYFQNIDLGLQDNEILPPLKGYKAYNTQLARAGKKLHWQEEQARNKPIQGGNFMDDFENEGEEEVEEEEESLTRVEEEARARAEKQEVLRQQEEAERAREEEQRLADIASDMLLQYMGRKQQPYLTRQKASMGANAAEDKRSEEVVADDDDDDLDQQMIDRLIEISSKLHLPADDVVEIISDVEEKKKKRKLPPPSNSPVAPRFRPLVPPPLAGPPIYHYTASSNPKKAPYIYKASKKWQKEKGKAKSYKQEYWYKPQKQPDYWYKPQKQFLAFPSYPYYQKPYRAYYPVYFPYPKGSRYYGKPSLSRDQQPFFPQDYGFQPARRRHRAGAKARGQSWRQQPAPRLPPTPYISNYILPHPRTYQPLPPPKPRSPAGRGSRRPAYYYPPVSQGEDYEEDGLEPQMDSDEELENFIERIYMKRRMF